MKLPKGWIFIAKPIRKGIAIELEQKELILCGDCEYCRDRCCKHPHWDISKITYPKVEETDFCSYAEERVDG